MEHGLPSFDEECFFIAPIGSDESDIRKRSDGVRNFIVKPAAEDLGLTTLRADDLAKPGQITLQVVEHLLNAKAAVADLTGANANVYYELAVRHTAKLPVVLIAEQEEMDRLPFDIAPMRVIAFDHRDLASASRAKDDIARHLQEGLNGAVDSPIATAMNLAVLAEGNAIERAIADLVTRVDALASSTTDLESAIRRQLDAYFPIPLHDLYAREAYASVRKTLIEGPAAEVDVQALPDPLTTEPPNGPRG